MPLAPAVSDFTAIAGSSLHQAIADDLHPAAQIVSCVASLTSQSEGTSVSA
jgi:hypothetical protein